MSAAAISALERGSRQAPYRSSVDLLAEGLGVDADARHQLHALAERWRKSRALPGRNAASEGSANNLPLQLSSVVGRTRERTEIEGLLREHRLVTLTGTGGIGKTRLALQVASQMLDQFPDGVWLVELGSVTDSALVPNAAAAVLGVQESPSRPMLETLCAALRHKTALLILDNCEHVLAGAADTVNSILRTCARTSILGTSVEAMRVAGEQLYNTPPLETPAAIALFVDRAQAVNPKFTMTDADAPVVADICTRLDGLPLAIELAAASVKTFPVAVLCERLSERFRLLRSGSRTAPRRQQTLHAVIEWSHELLSEQERVLFRRLAIFVGGFTLELAATVVSGATLNVFELLPSLVEKSLVQIEISGERPRYRFLESTRLYALEELFLDGEYHSVARVHAVSCLDLAQHLAADFETMPDRDWKALAEPELENWRAALEWTLGQRRDIPLGQRLGAALSPVWASRAAVEGRRWIQMAFETIDAQTPPATVGALYLADANIDMYLTLWKAMLVSAQRAVELLEQTGNPHGATEGRIIAGRALALLGRPDESEALLGPALEACRALHRPRLIGMALESLAMARMTAGDVADARPLFAQALSVFESIEAEQSLSNATANLAGAEFRAGNVDAALRLAVEALAKYQASNNPREVLVLANIAAYLVALGRWGEAREEAWKSLMLAVERQMDVQAAWALQHLAAVATLRHNDDANGKVTDYRLAAQMLGYVDAQLDGLDATRKFTEQQEYLKLLDCLRNALGAGQLSSFLVEGATWTQQQALAQAHKI
jgi:predicted ATPase